FMVVALIDAKTERSAWLRSNNARAALICAASIMRMTWIASLTLLACPGTFWTTTGLNELAMAFLPIGPEVTKHQLLKERLLAYDSTLDEETLRDTLEGITDLHEMIAAVIRSALVDEALQGGLRSRIDEMKRRLLRLEERGAKKRQLALEALSEVGLGKLEQPDFTASVRAGGASLIVVSDDLIPETYWVPQLPKLDRKFLLAELKRGRDIPGAQLCNPKPILAVRTK